MTINAKTFWEAFCEQKALKHFTDTNSRISKAFSNDIMIFLNSLEKNNIKLRPNEFEKEFLLDGILFEEGIVERRDSNKNKFVKQVLVGIEWQWDWGKRDDLLYHDFTKLLHIRCPLKILIFYIRETNQKEWDEEYKDALQIIEVQINESNCIDDEFLIIGIHKMNSHIIGTATLFKSGKKNTFERFFEGNLMGDNSL